MINFVGVGSMIQDQQGSLSNDLKTSILSFFLSLLFIQAFIFWLASGTLLAVSFFFFNNFFIDLFIFICLFFWLRGVFVAASGLSLVVASGGYSLLQCAGFSLRWLLLWSTGSRRAGFSSCGTRTQ